MKKKQGPSLAATALRPFAEATRSDDVGKLLDGVGAFKPLKYDVLAGRTEKVLLTKMSFGR